MYWGQNFCHTHHFDVISSSCLTAWFNQTSKNELLVKHGAMITVINLKLTRQFSSVFFI